MKKIFIWFSLSFILLLGITVWLVLQKNETPSLDFFLQQRWPELSQKLNWTDTLELSHLLSEARPAELSAVDQLLAHYQDYNPQELQALFALSRSCFRSAEPPRSRDLQKPWLWVSFTCAQKKLPRDFFKKPPYIFPSGQSYVQLAEDLKFDFSGYLTSEEIKTFKSISEMMAVTPVGTDLNLQQIDGFINGEDILMGENFVYLKKGSRSESSRERIYRRTPKQQWLEALRTENFIFTDILSARCQQSMTNGCWVTNRSAQQVHRRYYLALVVVLDVAILVTAFVFFILDRQRRLRLKENHRFTLQMLTHELRTPVTTLALQLENLRHSFDHLSEHHQIDFLKMSQEVARLKNSMQMSYAYLQTDAVSENKLKMSLKKIELNRFLRDFAAAEVHLELSGTPLSIKAESNWLGLCLNNLIKNAFDHGKPPVKMTLSIQGNDAAIEVSDAGVIPYTDLELLTQPFQKGGTSQGLGLGLSIIRQVVAEMQGRLQIQQSPTRFTLLFRRIE